MINLISKIRENGMFRGVSVVGFIASLTFILFYQANTYELPTYDHATLIAAVICFMCSFGALPDHAFDFMNKESEKSTRE